MSLKPRKQRKHYPHLFLLNEKTFLRYLQGQYLEFDYCNITNHPYGDWQLGFYQLSTTKEKIFKGGYLFERIDFLVNKLTDDERLDYAPIFCSSWVVKNDNSVIEQMAKSINHANKCYPKSKEKREERQLLRLNTWSSGWVAFENKPSNAITVENPMLTIRERKWWQKGFDDAKEDYEQERDSDLDRFCNLLKFTEKDYDKAVIEIIPYIFRNGIYELIDGAENIILTKENFQSFFTLLENNHNALSVIIESGELQNSCVRLDGTPYLSSLIMFQEFTETIKPLLNPNIEDEINNWKQLGCQYINIDFLQKKSYYY
ncbi:hypothetical protein ACPV3S_17340 [Photobacterium damselae]|uniref:hypothetical protein n=1 Tax=Photobacterium damselae TaxID=38293 RepID=UPI0040690B32